MNTPIIVGATYRHNGKNRPRNGWIGRVISTESGNCNFPIVVSYKKHNTQTNYSVDWFMKNMILIDNLVPLYDYIIWNPESDLPPKRTYPTYEEAERVSQIMRNKHSGEQFYVMKRARKTEECAKKQLEVTKATLAGVTIINSSEIEDRFCNELSTECDKIFYHHLMYKGAPKMKEVKLLCVDDKVIEITEYQADLLSTDKYKDTSHSYIIKTALKNNDDYYEANKIHVTKKD